jgi:hypothetical protein
VAQGFDDLSQGQSFGSFPGQPQLQQLNIGQPQFGARSGFPAQPQFGARSGFPAQPNLNNFGR